MEILCTLVFFVKDLVVDTEWILEPIFRVFHFDGFQTDSKM